jgi:hypothetical protein
LERRLLRNSRKKRMNLRKEEKRAHDGRSGPKYVIAGGLETGPHGWASERLG